MGVMWLWQFILPDSNAEQGTKVYGGGGFGCATDRKRRCLCLPHNIIMRKRMARSCSALVLRCCGAITKTRPIRREAPRQQRQQHTPFICTEGFYGIRRLAQRHVLRTGTARHGGMHSGAPIGQSSGFSCNKLTLGRTQVQTTENCHGLGRKRFLKGRASLTPNRGKWAIFLGNFSLYT